MRALMTDGRGGVGVADVPDPPASEGRVLVRVRDTSLNRGELRTLAGPAGVIPGSDVAGELLEPAAGLPAGTRVAALVDGAAWAELVRVPAERLAPVPDTVELAAAATLPTAGLTALQTLELARGLLGRRVLITGASGGVGRFAIQLARRGGAHVTAVARDARRAAGLVDLGADEVVYGIEATDGRFDVILDSVGGDVLTEALRRLGRRGDLVSFGGSADAAATYDPRFMFKNAAGSRIHPYRIFEAPRLGPDLTRLVKMLESGRLDPQVERLGRWEAIMSLLAALRNREINGKAVVEVP
jgi:NADPH:quinone reductase-like Zn-dependent oxidoreductase